MDALNGIVRHWLAYLILAGTFVGLGFLVRDRAKLAAALLGLLFIYFSLGTGASYWQGSRLHYPAEMAWAILAPYALYRLLVELSRLIQKLKIDHAALKPIHRLAVGLSDNWRRTTDNRPKP